MGAPAAPGRPPSAPPDAPRRCRVPGGRALIPWGSWRYRISQQLRRPRAAFLRRRLGPDPDPIATSMLELHAYSGAIVGFFRATVANPDILVEADLDEQSVVLDVGAFVGEWSERIDERYEPTILAFEPNPNAFRSLERRMGRRPNVALFEIGLGATEAVTTLDTAQGPGATLYGDPASDHLERVQIRDVVAVLADQGIDHVDLLKVNIEGAEFDLIDRLIDTGWIDRIDTISIQFHEWHPHAHRRRRRIRSELARTHVEAWCYPWVWELWTRAPAATAPDQKMIGTESPG